MKSAFLRFSPTVFAIENRYEILVFTKRPGQVSITVGKKTYQNQYAGVLASETSFHKIAVPMAQLNKTCKYTVSFRESIEKSSYYPKFGESMSESFSFRPLTKEADIHIYHTADVHCRFSEGVETASYFGNELDLLIVNGDISEVNTMSDFVKAAKYVSDISKGRIPVVLSRGNHDTRGKLAYRFSEFFPTEKGNHYFTVTFDHLKLIVLDCGEDKVDASVEYNGVNDFSTYRKAETSFLRKLKPDDNRPTFVVSHICPVRTTPERKPVFDIERDTYSAWNRELERLGVRFSLSGHTHIGAILPPNSGLLSHAYPLVIGSEHKDTLLGCALILHPQSTDVYLTNAKRQVVLSSTLK